MKMFITVCRVGQYAVRARDGRQATAWVKRRHGIWAGPYRSVPATTERLRDHYGAGGVFWDASSDQVVPKGEAKALIAGPSDFAEQEESTMAAEPGSPTPPPTETPPEAIALEKLIALLGESLGGRTGREVAWAIESYVNARLSQLHR